VILNAIILQTLTPKLITDLITNEALINPQHCKEIKFSLADFSSPRALRLPVSNH
jgi:hypothetical protein